MKWIAPHYYPQFRCIGGKCPHNCCIGWEIDIDEESLVRYRTVPGALGRKLRKSIAMDGCAHFILDAEERCPFLNKGNLCELILAGGEGDLCQICRDHPRFYNEWTDRTEVGVGLCCPAAAELILCDTAPMHLLPIGQEDAAAAADESELQLLSLRDRLFLCLQDRARPIEERFAAVLRRVGLLPDGRSPTQWAAVYRPLERMDAVWDVYLERLHRGDIISHSATEENFSIAQEQLAVYFLYRHLFGALEDGRIAERTAFAVHGTRLLSALARDRAELAELSRLYSAEIEYSDENLGAILSALNQ